MTAAAERTARGRSPFERALGRFCQRKAALAATAGLTLVAAAAIAVPAWTSADPSGLDLALGAAPPSRQHWFGTDTLGRDLFLRVLDGARISLGVGFLATLLSLAIGVPYGAAAGYAGRATDAVLMRVVDVLYSLPSILFVLLLLAWFGRDPDLGLTLLFVGLGAVSWLTTARIVRGQVLSLREREFVAAARLAGSSGAGIVLRHLVPQTAGPVLAYATLTVPRVMVEEAFLSFLGLGVAAPRASWGTLLFEGIQSFAEHPWLVAFPGGTLAVTLFLLYTIGDALRDAFDPRESRS